MPASLVISFIYFSFFYEEFLLNYIFSLCASLSLSFSFFLFPFYLPHKAILIIFTSNCGWHVQHHVVYCPEHTMGDPYDTTVDISSICSENEQAYMLLLQPLMIQ